MARRFKCPNAAFCNSKGCGFCKAAAPVTVSAGDVFCDVDTKGRTIRVESVEGERANVVVTDKHACHLANYPTHVFGFPWYARVA